MMSVNKEIKIHNDDNWNNSILYFCSFQNLSIIVRYWFDIVSKFPGVRSELYYLSFIACGRGHFGNKFE